MHKAAAQKLTCVVWIAIAAVASIFAVKARADESAGDLQAKLDRALARVQFIEPGLEPDVPSPEAEGSVTPRSEALPTPAPRSDGASLFDSDGEWLLDSAIPEEEGTEAIVTDVGPFADSEGYDEPAPIYSTGTWFRSGNWFTQQDFVMLLQSDPGRVNPPGFKNIASVAGLAAKLAFFRGRIAVDQTFGQTLGNGFLYMQSQRADPRFEPGARLTLGRFLGRDVANRDFIVDFTFLGFFEWSNRVTFASTVPGATSTLLGGLAINLGAIAPIPVPGFSNADVQSYLYESDLNSFELNFRRQGRPARDVLALQPNGRWVRYDNASKIYSFFGGLRFISANDRVTYTSEAANPITRGLYVVQTHNDMVGLQLGLEVIEKYTLWNWGFRSRIGGLTDFADRFSVIRTVNGIPNRSEKVEDENLVFLAEGGLFVAYQIRPNLSLRAAYDALFLTGIAQAPRNLSLQRAFPEFNVNGDAIYQGGSIGFEMVW